LFPVPSDRVPREPASFLDYANCSIGYAGP
jgi:hypothetical protein